MTVIIPAYKPDEKLIRLLESLSENKNIRILLVNDGSGEQYDAVFEKASPFCFKILSHKENMGKGAALKTAFSFLLEEGEEKEPICTADADGQHLPEDIFSCLKLAEKNPGSLVLGSRSFTENVPARSRFGNSASRFTFRLFMGQRVQDTQTGLRAFTPELLPFLLSVSYNRYEYEMKALCEAARKKIPILETKIKTVYLEKNKTSHFNPFKDTFRVYFLLLRCALGSFWEVLSFLFSSCFSYIIDLSAYALFLHTLFPHFMEEKRQLAFYSLLAARVLSSLANFFINGKVVFGNLKKPLRSMILYFLLVVFIFFANESLNALFLLTFGLGTFFSHALAQCLCFPVSFLIQKYLVFPQDKNK